MMNPLISIRFFSSSSIYELSRCKRKGSEEIKDGGTVESRSVSTFLSPGNPNCASLFRLASTLVIAEHERVLVKKSSLSTAAAAAPVDGTNLISILLGGSGPALQKAASHATSCHPSVSQVADYALVGDIFDVIPELLNKLPLKR